MKIHELEVEGIIKYFGNDQVLSDIYLKCRTDKVIGILGRNGSGKSILLKIIFGTLPANNKSIRINKKTYVKPYLDGKLIGYLPQHGFLPKNMRLRNIARVFLEGRRKKKLLEDERIKKHLDKRVSELSGGELRYFEIFLLVNLSVKFILLDEPFSGIEPLYKEKVKELIKAYRSEKGFIITDHDYRNIIDASDHIILINNGACRGIDKLKELEEYNYLPKGTFSNQDKSTEGKHTVEADVVPFEIDTQTLKDLDLFDFYKEGAL